jgi:ATP-dependent RNA helicase DeaD
MPEPEELIENTPEARRAAQQERHRPGFEDTVWFRMNIGRRQNADPRWILPLLCRRGHVTRGEIGAIRIMPGETQFQVPRAIAAKFAAALDRTADTGDEEGAIIIEPAEGAPRDAARENRRQARHHAHPSAGLHPAPPRPPKPHRKGQANASAHPGEGRPPKPWKGKAKGPSNKA